MGLLEEGQQWLTSQRNAWLSVPVEYLRRDGERLPAGKRLWVASPSLYRQLQPPEKRVVKTGRIRLPRDALWNEANHRENAFGSFHYRKWILPPPSFS